jgi:hypothetical protein
MPEPTSRAALVLIEKLELWYEFAYGHRDLRPSTRVSKIERPRSELLQRLHEIYIGYSRGILSEQLWARLLGVLPALLSTVHFKAQWDFEKIQFPEDFRALMHRLGG